MKRYTLPLTGMSCANCAARIERELAATDGVVTATVNFATAHLSVELDEPRYTLTDLAEKIRILGYELTIPSKTGELTFGVTGLNCASCVARLEKALLATPGVSTAIVNLAANSAFVRYNPEQLDSGAIFRIVIDTGYTPIEKGQTVQAEQSELRTQQNWFIFSLVLSIPLMASMSMHHLVAVAWLNFVLATVVQFTAGLAFYRGAFAALRSKSGNMDLLVALGTSAAWGYSTASLLGLFGPDHPLFFETSAWLITFIRLGKYLEARARGKAGEALRSLLHLQADSAMLVTEQGEQEVPASVIRVGDRVAVRAGGIIPVDGMVVSGSCAVDESMITGESIPTTKQVGDMVTGATINRNGSIIVEATRIGEETLLAQIVTMVRDAQGDKAPIQRFADAVSAWFVPAVILLSVSTFLLWYLLLSSTFLTAFSFAVAVMVIACPCAMGLATPTAIMVGSGIALQRGILVKKGSALESIAGLKALLLDKTGTITKGTPQLVSLVSAHGVDRNQLLRCLASAEAHSNHPLAQAAVAAAAAEGIAPNTVSDLIEREGYGLICTYQDCRLLVGNQRLMDENEVESRSLMTTIPPEARGSSLVYIAVGTTLVGIACFADPIKPTSAQAIARLRQLGIKTIMVTGDRRDVAESIAKQAGVDAFEAEVLPDGKLDVVRQWQQKVGAVGMVGDGINDAPALAAADVGIAIGSGTDVAKETGEIVLIRDDLMDAVRSIIVGRKTLSKVKQNLFWALIYNVIGIPIAAGLFSRYGIILKAEFAGLAMAFSSVSVVVNSLLLRRVTRQL